MADDAQVVKDIIVIRRLNRIAAAGGILSEKATKALTDLRAKYPEFEPSAGDRDDFDIYFSGGFRGPRGDPKRLSGIAADKLIDTALSIQTEERWEQGDLWSVLCKSEPSRAMDAMEAEGQAGNWLAPAWRTFLESVADTKDEALSARVLTRLLAAPTALLSEEVFSIGRWMYGQKSSFQKDAAAEAPFIALWDKFADVVYADPALEVLEREYKNDLMTVAINDPGGLLAAILIDALNGREPQQDSGIPNDLRVRATKAVAGNTQSNLLARVIFCERLSFIDLIDHAWATQYLVPHFDATAPDWSAMWSARAFDGHPGLSRLFNDLKPSMLAILARADLAHDEAQSLAAQLLRAYIWRKSDAASGYVVEANEVRQAFANASGGTRQAIAWLFMNWLRAKDEGDDSTPDKRWQEGIGPVFREVWPKDASLRDQHTSQQLLWMALSCDTCFPEAASFIENLIAPLEMYQIDITFDFDKTGHDLLRKYPRPYLRLLDAVIDPKVFRVPDDLGDVLSELKSADPTIVADDEFKRLSGVWKLRQSGP